MIKNAFLILLLFSFIACEEVIQVDLDNAEPQLIIEATIAGPGKNLVSITRSTDFYNPSQYEKISGAEVIVNEINGTSYEFAETSPGLYTNSSLETNIGSEYLITVNYDNKTYKANSYLPEPIVVDSIAAIGEKRPFRDELNYEYHVYFQDHPDIEDYARFKIYINGEVKTGIFRYDDRLSDGNYIDFNRIFFEDNKDVTIGDTVKIETFSIDKATFEYFDSLRKVLATSTGGPFGPSSPSNPITNWDNGALGYFSVYTYDSKTIIIK